MLKHLPRLRRTPNRAILAELDVPVPFDLREFCRRIEERRQRRLVLEPLTPEHAPGVCGLYIETRDRDLVYYAAESKDMHRDHVIVHELVHLLRGHGAVRTGTRVAVNTAALLPDLDPALIARVLGRSSYSTPDELEAETLASLIMQSGAIQPTSATGRLDDLLR